uniref:Uncharacterized protein n=1 Tax=Triticum urartu TaxID=4572 RepID=A0A8R7R0C0_TRIUA
MPTIRMTIMLFRMKHVLTDVVI